MDPKKYTLIVIISILVLLILTIVINRVVDPFWYFRDTQIQGINSVKTQFHSYEKQIKPIIFKEVKPDVVIFSNSFFEIGLRPNHPGLTQKGKYRSYNYGIVAADWDNIFCNVLYALEHTELKVVVIGIQASPMPKVDCSITLKPLGDIDLKTLLLSFDALRSSFNTLRQQSKPPTHTIDGLYYYHRGNSRHIEQVFSFYMRRYIALSSNKSFIDNNKIDSLPWGLPDQSDDISGLQYILQILSKKGVQVKLIVYPYHALWMELLMSNGKIVDRWYSLYNIAATVEQANQPEQLIELWDFQGFNDMLTERILNDHVDYWQDHGHFNFEMGDAMLDVIFYDKRLPSLHSQDDFGVLLTTETIPKRFEVFFERRKEFLQDNPWFIEDFSKFIK